MLAMARGRSASAAAAPPRSPSRTIRVHSHGVAAAPHGRSASTATASPRPPTDDPRPLPRRRCDRASVSTAASRPSNVARSPRGRRVKPATPGRAARTRAAARRRRRGPRSAPGDRSPRRRSRACGRDPISVVRAPFSSLLQRWHADVVLFDDISKSTPMDASRLPPDRALASVAPADLGAASHVVLRRQHGSKVAIEVVEGCHGCRALNPERDGLARLRRRRRPSRRTNEMSMTGPWRQWSVARVDCCGGRSVSAALAAVGA